MAVGTRGNGLVRSCFADGVGISVSASVRLLIDALGCNWGKMKRKSPEIPWIRVQRSKGGNAIENKSKMKQVGGIEPRQARPRDRMGRQKRNPRRAESAR